MTTILMTWMMMLMMLTVKADCKASLRPLNLAMNQVLLGYNFSTSHAQSIYQCMELCSYFFVCLSVNFFTGTQICQLN